MVDVHRSLDVNVHSLRFLRINPRVQLAHDVAYVFLPCEAFCDGDSKVFTCDHHLKCVAMETVFSVNDFPTSRGDPDDSALSGVEAHLPSLFQLFQCCEVFLEELSVMVVRDHLEDCAFINSLGDDDLIISGRSLMKIKNSSGLSTVPCGMPESMSAVFDLTPSRKTFCWIERTVSIS